MEARYRLGNVVKSAIAPVDQARAMLCAFISTYRCQLIDKKLPKLARHILRYLREHPEAQDTIEGITVWWVSERAIKQWLPQVRNALSALVARGYLEKHTVAGGRVFYRLCLRNRRENASGK